LFYILQPLFKGLSRNFGTFPKFKPVKCAVKQCTFSGSRIFNVPEEKRTDVNIAVHMITDAFNNNCDRFVIVSGDSDLVPAVRTVKTLTKNKTIMVYVPANNEMRGAARELRKASDKHRTLPNALLSKVQFPECIPDGKGGYINKPSTW